MEHDRENGPTFLDFPLFLGIFQWDEPTKRVPFTAEPEIPEILTKWKAPKVLQIKSINQKKFRDFNGIRTHGLSVLALQYAAVLLYHLSYEDPYIGSRPICGVHFKPWRNKHEDDVSCGNTNLNEDLSFAVVIAI